MGIPSVEQGVININQKVYYPGSCDGLNLDSPKGSAWLESISSFRFEPEGDAKPFTVRKESTKTGDYWYGYRKIAGKLYKKYVGKSSEVNTAKLEEIAEALNISPQSRVTDKVTEVADNERVVTDKVTDTRAEDRLTALESQVQALQESLEALRSELPGKSELGDSLELPKVDNEVVEQLQNELGNLKAENEALRQELEKAKYDYNTLIIISQRLNQQLEEVTVDRAKLLENSIIIKSNLERQAQELQSQLETEKIRYKELDEEFWDMEGTLNQARAELAHREKEIAELRSENSNLKTKLAAAPTENSETDFDFAGKAGELVSWLRKTVGKGLPKQVTLKEVQKILEGKDT